MSAGVINLFMVRRSRPEKSEAVSELVYVMLVRAQPETADRLAQQQGISPLPRGREITGNTKKKMNTEQPNTDTAGQSKALKFLSEAKGKIDTLRQIRGQEAAEQAHDFNPLNYIGIKENRWSRILVDLLNPEGEHGQKDLFLRHFLEAEVEVPTKSQPEKVHQEVEEGGANGDAENEKTDTQTIRSYLQQQTEDSECLSGTENLNIQECNVHTEHTIPENKRRIDILLEFTIGNDKYAIAIESKIWAKEQPKQVSDYKQYLDKKYEKRNIILFLTSDGRGAKSSGGQEYACISWSEIAKWLDASKRHCQAQKVRFFLTDFCNYIRKGVTGEMSTEEKNLLVKSFRDSREYWETAPNIIEAWQEFISKKRIQYGEEFMKEFKEKFNGNKRNYTLVLSNLHRWHWCHIIKKEDNNLKPKIKITVEYDAKANKVEEIIYVGATYCDGFNKHNMTANMEEIEKEIVLDKSKHRYRNRLELGKHSGWVWSQFLNPQESKTPEKFYEDACEIIRKMLKQCENWHQKHKNT